MIDPIMKKYFYLLPLAIIVIGFSSCKKENDNYTPSRTIGDYAPYATGKYITYKLDSLVYLSFGTRDTTISYEVKFVVDSLITDNNERPAWRIFRYTRKQAPDAWVPSATYWAINTNSSLEFIEDNMRFVKLAVPIENGTTWKGNHYIDAFSLGLNYLDDWDYVYDNVGQPASVGTFNFDDALTVRQRDEVIGIPGDEFAYTEVNYGEEVYARTIGMVYKKFFHSEFQPATPTSNGYYADGSYGITLTMIDHN